MRHGHRATKLSARFNFIQVPRRPSCYQHWTKKPACVFNFVLCAPAVKGSLREGCYRKEGNAPRNATTPQPTPKGRREKWKNMPRKGEKEPEHGRKMRVQYRGNEKRYKKQGSAINSERVEGESGPQGRKLCTVPRYSKTMLMAVTSV